VDMTTPGYNRMATLQAAERLARPYGTIGAMNAALENLHNQDRVREARLHQWSVVISAPVDQAESHGITDFTKAEIQQRRIKLRNRAEYNKQLGDLVSGVVGFASKALGLFG